MKGECMKKLKLILIVMVEILAACVIFFMLNSLIYETHDKNLQKSNDMKQEDKNYLERKDFENLLENVHKNVEVGTAGSSLKVVPYALEFINWAINSNLLEEDIKNIIDNKIKLYSNEELFYFKEQINLIYESYKDLIGDNKNLLLEDAGITLSDYEDLKDTLDSEISNMELINSYLNEK